MSYIIFGDNFSFPEGNAATNRVYTYAKGFKEHNINTYVICFTNDYVKNGNSEIEGIRYYHPLNQSERNRHFIVRNWHKIAKYYNTYVLIKAINKTEKVNALIVYTKLSLTHVFAWCLARLFGALLIIENSEHPLRYYRKGFFRKIIGELKLFIELKTLDGILLITRSLVEFYKTRLGGDSRILLVPSTVDPTRFKKPKTNNPDFKYIGYFGSVNFDRDNVDLLINSFADIHEKHSDLHLVLGGMYATAEEKLIKDLVKQRGIESKVHLLRYLSREEIVQYLINSHILVLVRSDDPDTNASFPCKLTEFLATGNPVIAVEVSEIPDYLTDGDNAFLIKPRDVKGLAEKLDTVMHDFPLALKVAKKGQDLTNSVFNYSYQAKRIIDFIENL